MSKDINIKFNLENYIEHKMTFPEKFELIKFIMFEDIGTKDFNKTINFLLNDLLEAEKEFNKREDIIKALEILTKTTFL